jgi:hypothetical protein
LGHADLAGRRDALPGKESATKRGVLVARGVEAG